MSLYDRHDDGYQYTSVVWYVSLRTGTTLLQIRANMPGSIIFNLIELFNQLTEESFNADREFHEVIIEG